MRIHERTRPVLGALAVALLLTACGGGGSSGDSGSGGSGPAYPLQAGYKALLTAGQSHALTVTGSCPGTATFTATPAIAATFESIPGSSSVNVLNGTLTNCTVGSLTINATNYYDANGTPLGSVTPLVSYTAFASTPPPLPTSVRAGETGTIANLTVYTDSTKATVAGRVFLAYSVTPDTASTAFVTISSQGYNGANVLVVTQLTRYRISADGTLSLVDISLVYSGTSANQYLLTKV